MSDNGFIRLDRLKTALSQVKTKVDSDIAEAISESTISLTSLINSGDASTLSEAKGYADGLKIIIDSNISSGDSSTLTSANSYTDSKISSVNLTINDLNESIQGQINLALEGYTEYSDFSDHTSNTSNPHNVTAAQVGAAASSHTHVESDITDLGNYSVIGHSHTVSDITDSNTLATNLNLTTHTSNINNPHQVTKSQVGLSNVDNTSDLNKPISTAVQSALNDLEDRIDAIDEIGSSITLASLGGASATDLTNHISDTNNPHNVTYTQTGAAATSHTHELTDVTDITATATEVNYLTNSTNNIQMQLNDARIYGFFPEWKYEHEYDIGDCVKTEFCKPTEYFECIVKGISRNVIDDNTYNDTGVKLSEIENLYNGETFIDGSCVWLVQDLRDTRPIGAIQPMIWRPMTTYNNLYYGIGLINPTNLFIVNSNNNVAYIRFIKYCIGSAIFTKEIASDHRLFDLTIFANISGASDTLLCHLGGALVVLDWCFNPFNYLDNNHYSVIDDRAWDYIENILDTYNSTYDCILTKNQIISNALIVKDKIKNNNLPSGSIFTFRTTGMGGFPYLRQGNYGTFQDAGLPNIQGSVRQSQPGSSTNYGYTTVAGAFSADTSGTDRATIGSSGGVSRNIRLLFNASNSNSIYGNSTTVVPKSINVYYLVKY